MLAGGIATTSIALIAAATQAAEAFYARATLGSAGIVAVYALGTAAGFILYGPLAIFLFAAAHSMRRHGSAPAWVAWLGYAATALSALATLSVFSAMQFIQWVGWMGFVLFLLWLLATSYVLVRSIGERAASDGTASTRAV